MNTAHLRTTLFLLLAGAAVPAASAADFTTICIADSAAVTNVERLGINFWGCGEAFGPNMPLLKKRVQENFEGSMFRRFVFSSEANSNGIYVRQSGGKGDAGLQNERQLWEGATVTIVSGPDKWTKRRLKQILSVEALQNAKGRESRLYYELDKPFRPHPKENGFLLEVMRTNEGFFEGLQNRTMCSSGNELVTGDVHPGAFGCAALLLRGEKTPAFVRFNTHNQRGGQLNGTWRVRFWAKSKEGAPNLAVVPSSGGEPARVTPPREWKQFELRVTVRGISEATANQNPDLSFRIEVKGGAAVLDDVEIWQEGDTNPTPFRDDLVRTLQRLRPGSLRMQLMGGCTVENCLLDRLHACKFSYGLRPGGWSGTVWWGIHEMYQLCEHVGANPWFTLPGTMTTEEMARFMEYVGAPTNVGWGQRRAALGHPQPWTKTLRTIHIEIGNEWFTFGGSGYAGPDYWQDLIAAAKKSPHYTPNVVFHVNPFHDGARLDYYPNADYSALPPCYLLQSLDADVCRQHYANDEDLFRFVFAYPLQVLAKPPSWLAGLRQRVLTHPTLKPSCYETGWHTTFGSAPEVVRNKVVASLGGGLGIMNYMLLRMREDRLPIQLYYDLNSFSFRSGKGGPLGDFQGQVRIWGAATCMRPGMERYRPSFLAMQAANSVIGNDVLPTVHSGAAPAFDATGSFEIGKGAKVRTATNVPALHSYAFREGRRRGLVVFNLDVRQSHPVRVEFSGSVAGGKAQQWLLTADRVSATNEPEEPAPQVALREQALAGFCSGKTIELPPHSMMTLGWETAP